MSDIEALARMEKVGEMLPLREFVNYVQFLDDVFKDWYRKHHKKKK